MTAVAEQTAAWLASFTDQKPAAASVGQLREAAFRRFSELGFPTTHDEEWRFTNVAPIARTRFERPISNWDVTPGVFPSMFFNGRVAVDSFPKGVRLATPEEIEAHLAKYASYENRAFVALNTAFLNDIVALRIERGAVIEEPIHILYGGQILSCDQNYILGHFQCRYDCIGKIGRSIYYYIMKYLGQEFKDSFNMIRFNKLRKLGIRWRRDYF
jgi:hypothetical protein